MAKAWQRQIREKIASQHNTSVVMDIQSAVVKETCRSVANDIISQYEWLGGIGNAIEYYGLFCGFSCAGVVCFGFPSASAPRTNKHPLDSVVGSGYGAKVIQLVRGACVHWAHPHSASKLISGACKLFGKKHPDKKIVLAYADERAGEVGTVYQACNWLYIGKTKPKNRDSHFCINGKIYDVRDAVKKFGSISKETLNGIDANWYGIKRTPKHQYLLWIGAPHKGKFWKKQITTCPYPKRNEDMIVSEYFNNESVPINQQLTLF